MGNPDGEWYIELDDGREFGFYAGWEDENPLEEIDAFDCGNEWSMDIPELNDSDEFPDDPDDNTFIRIPKDDVADVFFRPYGSDDGPPEPAEINVMSGEEFIEEVMGETTEDE